MGSLFTHKLIASFSPAAGLLLLMAVCVAPVQSQTAPASQTESAPAHSYTFEVASIKPNKSAGQMMRIMFSPGGFNGDNIPIADLIKTAYDMQYNQIIGAPGWLNSDHYDVEAKMDSETADAVHKMNEEDGRKARQQMLRALLADRMKLVIHRETREQPLYELVVAKNGSKLQEAKPGDNHPNGIKGPDGVAHGGMMRMGRGEVTGQGLPVSSLAHLLTMQLGRTVVDKTGLTGKYDFTLHWTPDESQGGMFRGPGLGPGTDPAPGGATTAGPGGPASADNSSRDSGPTIFTAIQEQLGLKLESAKGPVEVIVIDHVERPSEN